MFTYVVAQGVILEGPAEIESDRHVTAFVLGTPEGREVREWVASEMVATCEVVCVGDLATRALEYVEGDRILVAGSLKVMPANATYADDPESQYVRLEIHAVELGVSL